MFIKVIYQELFSSFVQLCNFCSSEENPLKFKGFQIEKHQMKFMMHLLESYPKYIAKSSSKYNFL